MAFFVAGSPSPDLPPDQLALRPSFVKRWTRIGLSTEPADRPRAERGLASLYRRAGFDAPLILWLPCLMSAALTAGCHAKIPVLRRLHKPCAIDEVATEALENKVSPAFGSQVRQRIKSAVCDALALSTRAVKRLPEPAEDNTAAAIRQLSRCQFMWFEDEPYHQTLGAIRWPLRNTVWTPFGQRLRLFARRAALVGYADPGDCLFMGAQFDADFYACQEFLQHVTGGAVDQDEFDVAASCGFVWMFDGVCIATERPSTIRRDMQQRLHSADAQSLGFAGTGWGWWTWHGLKIPPDRAWLIEHPDRITRETILAEEYANMRRAMCERIGWPVAIERLGGMVVAEHAFAGRLRQLIDIPLAEGRRMRLLRITFPDAVDPLRQDYVEDVPDEITTLHAAEAYLFGINLGRYREAVRQ